MINGNDLATLAIRRVISQPLLAEDDRRASQLGERSETAVTCKQFELSPGGESPPESQWYCKFDKRDLVNYRDLWRC